MNDNNNNNNRINHLDYGHVVMNPTQLELGSIQRISLTGFPARSVGSSNTDAVDWTKFSYPVDTSLIHLGSLKSPTAVLFDVDTRRISIRHSEMLKSITLNVLARSQG
ncbi:hypothetical protein Tco_1197450 [Tanacetum coccineum]